MYKLFPDNSDVTAYSLNVNESECYGSCELPIYF